FPLHCLHCTSVTDGGMSLVPHAGRLSRGRGAAIAAHKFIDAEAKSGGELRGAVQRRLALALFVVSDCSARKAARLHQFPARLCCLAAQLSEPTRERHSTIP